MAEKWKLKGYWANSCSCDPGCPCLFYSDPTKGYCDGVDTLRFTEGNYGKVKLGGTTICIMAKAPGNFWKGNWTAALYIDEKANPAQREALQTIASGKAGGPMALLASLIGTMKGTKFVPIKADFKGMAISIPGIYDFKWEPIIGGDKKKPIRVTNHPLSPVFAEANMGKALTSHFKDYEFEFDNMGKDCNWAPVSMAGP